MSDPCASHGGWGFRTVFRGQFEHTIDSKGRLSIPARFREALAAKSPDRLIVTRFTGCAQAYTVTDFEAIERKLKAKPQDHKVRQFIRFFVGGAHECELDPQGRIVVPPALRLHAGLEKDVVLVGNVDCFEIWAAANWKTEDDRNNAAVAADPGFIPEL